jgi:hypothetical protein
VSFELQPEAFALWDDHQKWVVEPAKVAIEITPDSAGGKPAVLEIVP